MPELWAISHSSIKNWKKQSNPVKWNITDFLPAVADTKTKQALVQQSALRQKKNNTLFLHSRLKKTCKIYNPAAAQLPPVQQVAVYPNNWPNERPEGLIFCWSQKIFTHMSE